MATINVSVSDTMRDWVRRRVDNGDYASESEFLSDLIKRDQEAFAPHLSVQDIRRSIEESRTRDRTFAADEVFEKLESRLKALAPQE